jgi:Phage capsid family
MNPTRERIHDLKDGLQPLYVRKRELREARDLAESHGDTHSEEAAERALQAVEDQIQSNITLQLTLTNQALGMSDFARSETFLNDPATVAQLGQLAYSQAPIGNVQLGPYIGRDQLVAEMTSGAWHSGTLAANGNGNAGDGARRGSYYGAVPQLRRALRLLDLIPTAPMDGNSFEYTQEGGDLDTAAETAEGAIKPTADVDLPDAEVIARTIAHSQKLIRQQLADVSGLDQLMRSRLMYGVMRRLENQIVSGNGQGILLRGILNTTGIGDVAFDADEALSDLTLDGIVTTLMSDADPDAIVVNPKDWSEMLKARVEDGGVRLDSDGAFATPPDRLWGLPAIASKVMPAGQALVGAFARGATVFVREAVNVRMSDSDQDDFTRNRVTLLAEGRFGLAVWQPTAFTRVRFAAA